MAQDFEDMSWYEEWTTLIDGGESQCSLNAVVDPESMEVLYIVEQDGVLEDFNDYHEALEDYIRKSHSNLLKYRKILL